VPEREGDDRSPGKPIITMHKSVDQGLAKGLLRYRPNSATLVSNYNWLFFGESLINDLPRICKCNN
jgi:hypothetical protein